MIGTKNNSTRVDLRKKTSLKDELIYSNIDLQSCMVVLLVIIVLLLSVFSVAAAHSPII